MEKAPCSLHHCIDISDQTSINSSMGLCASKKNAEGNYDPSPFTLFVGTASKVSQHTV